MLEPTRSVHSNVLHVCLRLALILPFSCEPCPFPCLRVLVIQRKTYTGTEHTKLKGKDPKVISGMIAPGWPILRIQNETPEAVPSLDHKVCSSTW